MDYLNRKCHTPTKAKSKPDFIESVRLTHNRIKFSDPRTEPPPKNEADELQQCISGRSKK